MQVSKWGNSLAVRLPAAVVEALGLEEGDQIEIRVAGDREFEVTRDRSRQKAIAGARFQSQGFEVLPTRRPPIRMHVVEQLRAAVHGVVRE